jgi:SNF2 family DNA or RNA helicase
MDLTPAEQPHALSSAQLSRALALGIRQGKLVETRTKKNEICYTLSTDELASLKETKSTAKGKGKGKGKAEVNPEKAKRRSAAGAGGKKKKKKRTGNDEDEDDEELGSGSEDEEAGGMMTHQTLPGIGTTLIVMPVTLLDQWETEIKTHTGGALKVLQYHGTVGTRPSSIPVRAKDEWSLRRELGYGYSMSEEERTGLCAAAKEDKSRFKKEMEVYERELKAERKVLEEEASAYVVPDFGSYDVVITSYDAIEADLLMLPVREERRVAELRRLARLNNSKSDEQEAEKETHVELPPTPLLGQQWWRVVLDEAQETESHGAKDEYGHSSFNKQNELAKRLCQLATVNSWVITGTPVGQKIEELGKYLDFIDCKVYGNRPTLRAVAFAEYTARRKEGMQMVQGMLRDHCWRETKDRVKVESALPPITERSIPVELSLEDRRWYKHAERLCVQGLRAMIYKHNQNLREAADHGGNSVEMALPARFPEMFATLRLRCCHPQLSTSEEGSVASFHRRQAAADAARASGGASTSAPADGVVTTGKAGVEGKGKGRSGDSAAEARAGVVSSKLSALLKLVEETRSQDSGAKFVVFSQWIPLLVQAQKTLTEVLPHSQGMGSVLLRVGKAGSEAIAHFRDDPLCAVMCVCTRAGHGSAGLNLTNAQHVVLLEPSMDVGMEAQAVGRVHRLGQASEVMVHRLHAVDTIEEHVNKLQERRRMLYEVNERDGVGELITDANTW